MAYFTSVFFLYIICYTHGVGGGRVPPLWASFDLPQSKIVSSCKRLRAEGQEFCLLNKIYQLSNVHCCKARHNLRESISEMSSHPPSQLSMAATAPEGRLRFTSQPSDSEQLARWCEYRMETHFTPTAIAFKSFVSAITLGMPMWITWAGGDKVPFQFCDKLLATAKRSPKVVELSYRESVRFTAMEVEFKKVQKDK
eukprot:g71104.t1